MDLRDYVREVKGKLPRSLNGKLMDGTPLTPDQKALYDVCVNVGAYTILIDEDQ